MKKTLACILLYGMFPGLAFGEPSAAPHTIQVYGSAAVRVVPDEVVITMYVATHDKDLLSGQKKVDSSISAVLEFFKAQGVKPEQIQTDYVDVSPVYTCNSYLSSGPNCDSTSINYYNIKKGIVVRLRDLSRYEEVINGALQKGVTSIENVQFGTSELRKYRDLARDMAVKAAKEKAEALAAALQQKIGKPISISENNNTYAGYYSYGGRNSSYNAQNNVSNAAPQDTNTESETSTSLGQIKVDAQVGITFELADK